MTFEVFISYSRRNERLCDEIESLIREKIGYKPFRDVDDLASGQRWREQIGEALRQASFKPYVVLLCTREARAEWDKIVRVEIGPAKHLGLTIVPIEFDSGSTKFLLGQAGFDSPGEIDYVDGLQNDGSYKITDRLEDKLRLALTSHIHRRMNQLRALSQAWAEVRQKSISFWDEIWEQHFDFGGEYDLPRSVALTARGGSGKSFLLAHCIRRLLERTDVYPVLVHEELLRTASTELPRLLGARDKESLARHVGMLSAGTLPERPAHKPLRVVFIIDGLDQMIIPGDVGQQQLVAGINLLASFAPVLIGCREEVWEDYAARVGIPVVHVAELDQRQVERLLLRNGLPPDASNPLLCLPLFLDVALGWSRRSRKLPSTITGFLRQLWFDAVTESGGTKSGDDGRDWLIQSIATIQLNTLSYEVPTVELHRCPGFMQSFMHGLAQMKRSGVLVEKSRPGHLFGTVRLRHDLLDDYSMLRVLLHQHDRLAAIRDLCERCDKDCGWSVLTMLIQYSADEDNEIIRREVFSEFLILLDKKRFGDAAMAKAWAVTHALRASFTNVLDLIVEVLSGEPVPSVAIDMPSDDTSVHSRLGPSPQATQEAASTLASAFMSLEHGDAQDAAKVIPVLGAGLRKWQFRARFVEAIGKYDTPDALATIVEFAQSRLAQRDDDGVLLYIARSLARFHDAPAALQLLKTFMTIGAIDGPAGNSKLGEVSKLRRVAAEIYDLARPGEVLVPLPAEEEIVAGLEIWNTDRIRYSDWREIQYYANNVGRRRSKGEKFSSNVRNALVAAMAHDQNYARCAVAKSLGYFDGPEACDALLFELMKIELSPDVRTACLDALRQQLIRLGSTAERQLYLSLFIREAGRARRTGATLVEQGLLELAQTVETFDQMVRDALLNDMLDPAVSSLRRVDWQMELRQHLEAISDPRERQAFRFLLLRAAEIAQQNKDVEFARSLAELATSPEQTRPTDWAVTDGALEVLPPASRPLVVRCVLDEVPVNAAIQAELLSSAPTDVGPNQEPKYRFTRLEATGSTLQINLAPTTWREGRGFHATLQTDRSRFARASGTWFLPIPLGQVAFPGLAVVHCVVMTADNYVLFAQRGAKVAYAPLHWSASFEEQVTQTDVAVGNMVFEAAAQRGMREEFGIAVDLDRIHIISSLLQIDNINVGIVSLIETTETLDEIREAWSSAPPPSHSWEALAIDSAAADPTLLRAIARTGQFPRGPLHPTSALRLVSVARWLEMTNRG